MPIPATQQQNVQVRLGPVNGQVSDDLIFSLNPSAIRREYDGVYVEVPIALADWSPTAPSSNPPPATWTRNRPERVQMDFKLVAEKLLNGSGNEDIEAEIKKLEDFRYKSSRFNGEPPDLVLSVGNAHDRVRIERMGIDPKLWTKGLYRQIADVQLQLIVIRPRSR